MMINVQPARKARFVETPSPEPFWRVLHRLADRAYPQLRDALAVVLREAGAEVSLADLSALLTTGHPLDILRTLEDSWRAGGLVALRTTLEAQIPLVIASAEATAATAGLSIAFNVADPAVLFAIETHVGTLVTEIDATTRAGIRAAVSTMFETGGTVGTQARTLRDLVGLTSRQAESVVRFEASLFADGMSPERITRLVTRRTAQLLRQRAELIARTETIRAASAGQQLLWEQAARQGLLDAGLKRFWVITPDDRLCPICRAIPGQNPQGVALEAVFQTPVGGVAFPPAHPACRCTIALTDIPPAQYA